MCSAWRCPIRYSAAHGSKILSRWQRRLSGEVYSKQQGDGPDVVLLHGLFGSGANLGMLGRHLREAYRVHALDLPGHGRSAWQSQYSVPQMAQAVVQWMDQSGLSASHLVGHSLGGKVAMQVALQFPQKVASLVIADIAPVAYPRGHDAVFAALNAVANAAPTSREEAASFMRQHLQETDVIQFLLTSLRRDEAGVYRWRMDVAGLEKSYGNFIAALEATNAWPGPVLFIKGALSNYIIEAHAPAVRALFPQAELKELANTGHWLHAEKPTQFNGLASRFLARQG